MQSGQSQKERRRQPDGMPGPDQSTTAVPDTFSPLPVINEKHAFNPGRVDVAFVEPSFVFHEVPYIKCPMSIVRTVDTREL
jgi:hypothetical protein